MRKKGEGEGTGRASSTESMLARHDLFILSISAADSPAQRPLPVPRGLQGQASSDGRPPQLSSRKLRARKEKNTQPLGTKDARAAAFCFTHKPSTFGLPRPYCLPPM